MESRESSLARFGRLPLRYAALVCLLLISSSGQAREDRRLPADPPSLNQHYRIEIDVGYHSASFTGREVVRFDNFMPHELENVCFHLYPNVGLGENESPWLTVRRVSAGGRELRFSLKSRNTVLKVELPHKLEPG